MTTEVSIASLSSVNVEIETQWPPGMIVQPGSAEIRDKISMLQYFLPYDEDIKQQMEARSLDFIVPEYDFVAPTELGAIASYGMSLFWNERLKNSRSGAVFNIKLKGSSKNVIPVYSLRGIANPVIDIKDAMLTDDFIHLSTALMNQLVNIAKEKKGVNLMSPLSRVCITDAKIESLATETNKSVVDVIKTLNISCLKKSYQMEEYTKFYDPNYASAFVIRSAMSNKATKLTENIASKQLVKIGNNSTRPIDSQMVVKILSKMTGSAGSDIDMQALNNAARNLRTSEILGKANLPFIAPQNTMASGMSAGTTTGGKTGSKSVRPKN